MKKKKTIFHLLNHDQTIKITEDNENNGFKYYIEHRKHKNIIYLFKDNNDENSNVKYGYCLKCSKFISRDSSNISKHQNSLHKTFVENLEEINNKIMIVFSWWKCLWYIGQVIITMYMCNWCV